MQDNQNNIPEEDIENATITLTDEETGEELEFVLIAEATIEDKLYYGEFDLKDGKKVDKYHPELPLEIVNIVPCKNPRCITSTEQELPHVFKLTDRETRTYRCIYCESKAKN